MNKDFKQGDLVWAKMKGFPPWPARIAFPADGKTPKSKKPQHYVYFFGTHDFAWILDQLISPHSEEMLANAKQYKKKSSTMQSAIQEIEKEGQKVGKKSLGKEKSKKEPVAAAAASLSPPPSPSPSPPLEVVLEKLPPKSPKKKPVAKKKVTVERKTPKKRSASAMLNDPEDQEKIDVKKDDSDEDYSLLIANVPPNNGYPNVAVIPPYNDDSKPNFTSMYMNGMDAPLDPDAATGVKTKKIKNDIFQATSKKIGFLGLGVMGCSLVKRLLSTGHKVTIWNRSVRDTYTDFVEAGAKTAKNPAAVIQACDITFCCVSDAEASKNVVFGNQGVLAGFEGLCSSKAYVEMSSIDPVTSQEIAEAIAGKGGRYLEAPMIGKRQDVSTSSLVILTAGDRALFADCNTVFASWAKHAFYLNCDVGSANKMRLVLSMLAGTTFAALAESIGIIEECNVNPAFFMEMVGAGPANFPLLLEKGLAMITDDETVYTPIKHQQKDLAMALELGNTSQQPLALAVAANEVFKRGLAQDGDSDVSKIHKFLK